jgi:O-acetyl-ADP-ribose deacetylase (regulator of RNase III)
VTSRRAAAAFADGNGPSLARPDARLSIWIHSITFVRELKVRIIKRIDVALTPAFSPGKTARREERVAVKLSATFAGVAMLALGIHSACYFSHRVYGEPMLDRLEIVTGDITLLDVDAIVNAANEQMLGGGGVDGAIHRAAGPELMQACRAVGEVRPGVRCPTGEARITPGYRLRARFVVHTVGPVWRGGANRERELLASCYRKSLALALLQGATSIAFPAISTGVYGFPPEPASEIAVREVTTFLAQNHAFTKAVLVAFRAETAEIMRRAVSRLRLPARS